MSFREKSALGMLLLLMGVALWYVVEMRPWEWTLHRIDAPVRPVVMATLAIILGSIVVQAGLAMRNPADAEMPADERERPILDRAGSWSGTVLGVGCVASTLHYLQHGSGALLFHTVYASLLLSAMAEFAFQLWLFRRQG
jgi:hypothetical protein